MITGDASHCLSRSRHGRRACRVRREWRDSWCTAIPADDDVAFSGGCRAPEHSGGAESVAVGEDDLRTRGSRGDRVVAPDQGDERHEADVARPRVLVRLRVPAGQDRHIGEGAGRRRPYDDVLRHRFCSDTALQSDCPASGRRRGCSGTTMSSSGRTTRCYSLTCRMCRSSSRRRGRGLTPPTASRQW